MSRSVDCTCTVNKEWCEEIKKLEATLSFMKKHKHCIHERRCDDETSPEETDDSDSPSENEQKYLFLSSPLEPSKKIKLQHKKIQKLANPQIQKKPAARCFITKVLKRKGMELDEIKLRKSKLSETTLNKFNQKYQVWVSHCKKKGINPVVLNVGELMIFFTQKIQSGISRDTLQQYLDAFIYIYPNPNSKDFRTFLTNIEDLMSGLD